MRSTFAELARRSKTLHHFGWLMVLLYALAGVMYFVDDTRIMGINAWIKPMKFALSIAIYSWTFGWLMGYVTDEATRRRIALGLVITMTAEIVLIYFQAFRGTTSHFNISTPADGIIFGVMGVFILLNTLLNAYTLWIFLRGPVSVTGTLLLAWRAGLTLFVLGGISGGWMVQILSHTVGAPDGGPGLPFLNWSTVAGDIRSAHFVSLHGLQVLPLLACAIEKLRPQVAKAGTALAVTAYALLCITLHALAWQGIPVIALH